ncbi:MAG TPA: helix-turn-helix domain-containing protein [Dehalococcoidia bacterium]|nr:helix-turn-helix domain-containing protein [Dehalococcoidia bacterium]
MVAVRNPWGASEVLTRPLEADEELEALARPSRRDALPEHTRYVDSGCEVHHSCLSCPLVRCRYDEPGGARRIFSAERDQTILSLRGEGRPISLIAQRFGISRRTVFRVLAAARVSA